MERKIEMRGREHCRRYAKVGCVSGFLRKGLLAGGGFLCLLFLSSCAYFGPTTIEGNRGLYNVSIQKTNAEQLLVNLVRLKYRDTPFFLEVSSVATQFRINPSFSASGALGGGAANLLNLGLGADYEEKPTVTYAPLQGDKFVERLLSPISFENILLLYHSGWSVERLFRVVLQRLNDLKNAPTASGPTPLRSPEYKAFNEATRLLRALQLSDQMDLGYEKKGDKTVLVMRFGVDSRDHDEAAKLRSLLGLAQGQASFPVHGAFAASMGHGNNNGLRMTTRSLMGVMFFLSQGVEVPVTDVEKGVVTVTRQENGEPFDWRQVTGSLLSIHSSSQEPENAAVAVQYRGSWFYIDDSSLASKSTFSLLTQLFALQAGKASTVSPLYTLPLN